MKTILKLEKATKIIRNTLDEDNVILNKVDLSVNKGDFITLLGGNGAGKSTLFNSITGSLQLTKGEVSLNDKEITSLSEENRAKWISRVFQDPKMGTAPRMTVAENLTLAKLRGKRRGLRLRSLKKDRESFKELTSLVGNGLDKQLDAFTGDLSGGQRQSLSLLMATLVKPELLLLDEHTAALDPRTSKKLMEITDSQIKENNLTCIMITHRMEDALNYGNRLIVMDKGQIKIDLNEEEKNKLTLEKLIELYEDNEIRDI